MRFDRDTYNDFFVTGIMMQQGRKSLRRGNGTRRISEAHFESFSKPVHTLVADIEMQRHTPFGDNQPGEQ
jgi:hypothetical protein